MTKKNDGDVLKYEIQKQLSVVFEKILKQHGNTPETRLKIADFTFGYMGVSYGLHVNQNIVDIDPNNTQNVNPMFWVLLRPESRTYVLVQKWKKMGDNDRMNENEQRQLPPAHASPRQSG